LKTTKQLIAVVVNGTIASFFATLLLIIWRQFNPTNLLFDQFCIISVILFGFSFLLSYAEIPKGFGGKTKEKSLAIALLTSLLYFSIVQYTVLAIDRSRSFYILSWVDQGWFKYSDNSLRLTPKSNAQGIDLDPNNLTPVKQRIDEQISRNLITINIDEIQLTLIGKAMVYSSNKIALVFNLKNWQANT
jgi:hypothetical protein